jgi:hypothetical protein
MYYFRSFISNKHDGGKFKKKLQKKCYCVTLCEHNGARFVKRLGEIAAMTNIIGLVTR